LNSPRIHLVAPAGSCRDFLAISKLNTANNLISLVQDEVGDGFRITGNPSLIDSEEDDLAGGRRDDSERAADLEEALSDDSVAAIVAIRGGAWLTRILPRIDFGVLNRRSSPVALFGFSEITSLVNIVGAHEMGRGVYDDAPAFLVYGLRHYAETKLPKESLAGLSAKAWAYERLLPEFRAFFRDVVDMISGNGTRRNVTARLEP